MAVGLILALAVEVELSGIDLSLVGWILFVVGAVGLIASLALMRRSRPVVEQPPVVREQRVVREPTLHEQPVVREEYPQQRIERREY